jgi:DNA replication and repair protein RecF
MYARIAWPMRLTRLSLTNFRNFLRLESEYPPGATLLVGANAQGKTSLLEAVQLLTGTSNPLSRNDRNLINFLALSEQQPFARIAAEVEISDRSQHLEIRVLLDNGASVRERRTRKQVLINGVKKRVRDLSGVFNAVLFVPQDLRVLEGPPRERRRYLDSAISQADPVYANTLAEYSKVVTQRNALLKQILESHAKNDELDFWDTQLVDHAANLLRSRALAIRELQDLAIPYHKILTRGEEALRIEYIPAIADANQNNGQLSMSLNDAPEWATIQQEEIRDRLRSVLERSRREEIARGMTLSGPHRDDFSFSANGVDLRTYGSRGQNRTAILAAKLAEVEWLKQRKGEWPVLLLDEILSELDLERRDALLECVTKVQQALITSTDLSMFNQDFLNQLTIWRVDSGTLTPMER